MRGPVVIAPACEGGVAGVVRAAAGRPARSAIRHAVFIATVTAMAAALVVAAGCASRPPFAPPAVSLPGRLTASPLPATTAGPIDPARLADRAQSLASATPMADGWWRAFGDARVDALVRQALADNPSLAAAQATLHQAHELALAQSAALWPTLDAGFAAVRTHGANASLVNNSAPGARTALLSTSYSPDLFGAIAKAAESARAQEDAARWQWQAARLALVGGVLDALAAREASTGQERLTTQLVAIDEAVLAIVRQRQRLGDVAMDAVWAQVQQVHDHKAALASARLQSAQARDLLASLVGVAPATFAEPLPADGRDVEAAMTLPDIPARLPGDVVSQRPDVQMAAAQLHAADATLAATLASRLPQVTLSGDVGDAAGVAGHLLNPASLVWDLGASITQSVFDAGAARHRSAGAQALVDAEAAQYRATVIGAFKNVADALEAVQRDAEAHAESVARTDAARRQWEIAQRGQALGNASRQDVLAAQAQAIQAEILQVQARAARLTDAANAFVALGGVPIAVPQETPP